MRFVTHAQNTQTLSCLRTVAASNSLRSGLSVVQSQQGTYKSVHNGPFPTLKLGAGLRRSGLRVTALPGLLSKGQTARLFAPDLEAEDHCLQLIQQPQEHEGEVVKMRSSLSLLLGHRDLQPQLSISTRLRITKPVAISKHRKRFL